MRNSEQPAPINIKRDVLSAIAALLMLAIVILAPLLLKQHQLSASAIGWIIIAADTLLCGFFWWEYFHGWRMAVDRHEYALRHSIWLAGAIPLAWHLRWLQSFRVLRLLRHIKLGQHWLDPWRMWGRALITHPLDLLAAATVVLLVFGSTILFYAEQGRNQTILSWWDALWLTVTSATTDSYGDVAPATPIGRIVAALIAISGIIIVGSLTGAIAGYIMREPHPQGVNLEQLSQQLQRLEAKIDKLAG